MLVTDTYEQQSKIKISGKLPAPARGPITLTKCADEHFLKRYFVLFWSQREWGGRESFVISIVGHFVSHSLMMYAVN